MIYKRRRIATLDLGTNSLLMLVAERDEEGHVTVLADESAVPRLGEGLRATGKVAPHVTSRVCEALRAFTTQARQMGVQEIVVTATSAAREAANREEILELFTQAAGVPIEILPPPEEARLSYISVTSEQQGSASSMVIDIGGGSTEITWGIGTRFDGGRSLDLGTVKLLEGPLAGDLPTPQQLQSAREEIDSRLAEVTPLGRLERYYGTAGTFTHLASVDLALAEYHPNRVAGHVLAEPNVRQWAKRLGGMTRAEKLRLPGVDSRRVDVLLPGTLIIERLFAKFRNEAFVVFDRGVRFGKLFDKLTKFLPPVSYP